MKKSSTRREFITRSSMAGAGTIIGLNIPQTRGSIITDEATVVSEKTIAVKPRYHRWFVDPGQEWLETNTGYSWLDWKIPLANAAVVLVDVWQRHYIKEPEERAEKIISSKLLPLLGACRKNGLKIIHAPSPEVAVLHPNWVKLQVKEEFYPKPDEWPPADFRHSTGQYKSFAMPFEPREEERNNLPALTFHPKVLPVGDEPVVATGEELHRYCKKNKIMFLLYAGFNTNACILVRDYGTLKMRDRGYSVILIRDCTTGMESKDSQSTLAQTNGAILFLEMFGSYSLTSDELIKAVVSG
jgi:nicotinamidase-related amidase